jgi:predicted nucleic-acid-binding protein
VHAADTNVVVRLLVRDDASQLARAIDLFRNEAVWIGLTVILETEWVLRRSYNYTPRDIGAAFAQLAGLPRVSVENPAALAQALRWYETGMDFADALHACSMGPATMFRTFDRDLARAFRKTGDDRVTML